MRIENPRTTSKIVSAKKGLLTAGDAVTLSRFLQLPRPVQAILAVEASECSPFGKPLPRAVDECHSRLGIGLLPPGCNDRAVYNIRRSARHQELRDISDARSYLAKADPTGAYLKRFNHLCHHDMARIATGLASARYGAYDVFGEVDAASRQRHALASELAVFCLGALPHADGESVYTALPRDAASAVKSLARVSDIRIEPVLRLVKEMHREQVAERKVDGKIAKFLEGCTPPKNQKH